MWSAGSRVAPAELSLDGHAREAAECVVAILAVDARERVELEDDLHHARRDLHAGGDAAAELAVGGEVLGVALGGLGGEVAEGVAPERRRHADGAEAEVERGRRVGVVRVRLEEA